MLATPLLPILDSRFSSSTSASEARTIDTIVAVVNGEPITYYDLKTTYAFAQGEAAPAQPNPRDPTSRPLRAFLEQLINDKIIAQEVAKRGIRVTEEEVAEQIRHIRRQNNLTEEAFRMALQDQGITFDIYREKMAEEMRKGRLIEMDVRSQIDITDTMIQAYFAQHQSDLAVPGKVTLSKILLRKGSARVAEVTQAIKAGKDFQELARGYSEDSVTASRGGRERPKDLSDLHPLIREKVSTAGPGDILGPLEIDKDVYFLRVEDLQQKRTPVLEDARDSIHRKLTQDQVYDKLQVWIDQLRSRSVIEVSWD